MTRHKGKIIALAILTIFITLRAALPAYLLKEANKFLDGYSKVVTAQIGDIDLSFFRMAYRLEKIEVKLRKENREVLTVGSVDVSLAWRELLEFIILTDVEIRDARVMFSPDVMPALEAIQAENAERAATQTPSEREQERKEVETIKTKFFPLRIERIVLQDSMFEYSPTHNAPEEKRLIFDQTQVRMSNVTPLKENAKTVTTFSTRVQRNARLKGVAQARVSKDHFDWDVDTEMRDFNLVQANPFLLDLVPFTFTKGKLDVFAEAKSESGAIIGYVKPFLTDVDVIARKEKFKNTKHFLTEIIAAISNVIAQKPKLKSVATKVDFIKAGPGADFKIDTLGAVGNAIEHRLGRPIAPSVEDEIIFK